MTAHSRYSRNLLTVPSQPKTVKISLVPVVGQLENDSTIATWVYSGIRPIWRTPLTVCAAAISNGSIVGASDRMLTSGMGDVEFEPPISKLHTLTENVCIMIAGDITLQTEILHRVIETVPTLPGVTWRVQEVAEAYFRAYQEAHKKRTQWALLDPLGIESASDLLLRGDGGIRIASDILNFKLPLIEALITGIDESGPHIYQVNNSGITCQDWVGFASIGGGAGHSNSQFMFARHTKVSPLPETLMLVYSAKKRAEVAPGVGPSTDMFLIEPPGKYYDIGNHVIAELHECYIGLNRSADAAMEAANGKISQYIQTIIADPINQPSESESPNSLPAPQSDS